ncbi:molybdopterin-guanine dinucleotide biosynthesis protein MobB [bacterium 210820-DFI.6.37]|nr:molybdopterin-guanine dinucleotide biosynthesis protein MobB [bacterium 210820-DFI.6.37]
MKVIMIKGITKTGKTTTAEAVIQELRRRGYTVGSVKEIHFEAFTMETEGSNTHRHKKAGAHPVTARGLRETDIMFDHTLDIDDVLDYYHQDYVVLEGDSGANCPVIITGRTVEQLDDQYNDRTIAVSGVISASLKSYRDLPIINGMTDIEKLVDLIEEKTPERMPNYSADCCTACGTDCRGLTARIIRGTGSLSECILKGQSVQLYVNGEEIPMVPFVKSMVRSVSEAMVGQLDGYEEGAEIVIKIKAK